MTKVQNHRSKLQAGTAKRKPSKSRRQKTSLKFWRKKALAVADVFKQIKDLSGEVEEVKKEKEEVESQLEVARKEIDQVEDSHQSSTCGRPQKTRFVRSGYYPNLHRVGLFL